MLEYVFPHPFASASHDPCLVRNFTSANRDTVIRGRATEGDDDSGIKESKVLKRASVSPYAKQAQGRQRGPRPGLAHSRNSSWGNKTPRPAPPPLSRSAPKVSVPVTDLVPPPALAFGASFAAPRPQPPRGQSRSAASTGQRVPDTHRLPGPSRGFGLRRKRGGPAWKAPPTRAQQGPIGARCGKLRPRP